MKKQQFEQRINSKASTDFVKSLLNKLDIASVDLEDNHDGVAIYAELNYKNEFYIDFCPVVCHLNDVGVIKVADDGDTVLYNDLKMSYVYKLTKVN